MLIREARLTDSKEIARLSLQHGYEVSETEVLKRMEKLLLNDDNAIYVIEVNSNEISSWIHIHGRHLIGVNPFAEIGGLVVDQSHRRKGNGEKLMRKCEDWARKKGYQEMRVRSGGQRKEAHEFYKNIGYKNSKWQEVFTLSLKE
ncbi:GNAT family N-acetyltransferase [Bacillus sp. EAC]|uniref:GNAT family N-acetyltransferase n=1 Tax=Bacillus sp. EAC TaxID=1978338 RepID=UPI000B44BC85|nr:GNAT family N-acetyltransferase [Bacillus sp. EAC]